MEDSTELDSPKKKAMIKALEASIGVVTTAAKMCNMHRSTHYRWINPQDEVYDKEYARQVKDLDNMAIDFVESKMFERINGMKIQETKVFQHRGNVITKEVTKVIPPDPMSINFFLATKGKHRGYVKRIETEEVGEVRPMRVVVVRNKQDDTDGE